MRQWSFNRKIALASLTVVIAVAVTAVAALAGFVWLERSVDNYQSGFDKVQTIREIELKLRDIRIVETDAILESEQDLLSSYPKRTADLFKELETVLSSMSSRSETQAPSPAVESLKAALLKRKEHSDQILRAAVAGDSDKALELYDFADKDNKEVQEILDTALVELASTETSRAAQLKKEVNTALRNWMYWTALVAIGCISLAPSLVHSSMNGARRQLMRSADNLLDSAHKIEPLIQKLNRFGSKFRQGRDASHAALQKSEVAIQMLADSLIQHADTMGKTAHLVAASSDESTKSHTASETVSSALQTIHGNTDLLLEKIDSYASRIEESLQVVAGGSERTKVINDLIFQTKIISFNAAVEAARAGEAGRGFSVVAEELAHLSQSSGQSAKDIVTVLANALSSIEGLLRESQEDFKYLLASSRESVERGSRAASECSESISAIINTTHQLSDLVGESGQALHAQLEGFASVSDSLKKLNESAFTEANLSGEYTTSVQELTEQSDNLRGLTRNLAASLKGGSHGTLRSRMNNSSNSNEIVKDIISEQSGKALSTTEEALPLLQEHDVRRKRTKGLAQRRLKERTSGEANTFRNDSVERPLRRKA